MKKLLIIQTAGLDRQTLERLAIAGTTVSDLVPPLPAVTCTAQASFRTATPPADHGMVANGIYDRALRKALFWEQSAALVTGPRLWDRLRGAGHKVGMLFWQQSLGESADYVLSPAPIHKHHGGMILDCYSQPREMYARLRSRLGEFPLTRYWGPRASARVGDWIAQATADVMAHEAPELLLTYLPTLDYDFQRHGPTGPAAERAAAVLKQQLAGLLKSCDAQGYEWVLWGDYAISAVGDGGVSFPNRALREAGLLTCRDVRGRAYADLNASRAFAVVDHAVAHVFVSAESDRAVAADVCRALPGVDQVLVGAQRDAVGLSHSRSGELVLIAKPGGWFAYPWWHRSGEAPDYASHVDIHNKPGFDPCELFMQWCPPGVAQDPLRVGGTHGRTDPPAVWTGSIGFEGPVGSVVELAQAVQEWINTQL